MQCVRVPGLIFFLRARLGRPDLLNKQIGAISMNMQTDYLLFPGSLSAYRLESADPDDLEKVGPNCHVGVLPVTSALLKIFHFFQNCWTARFILHNFCVGAWVPIVAGVEDTGP